MSWFLKIALRGVLIACCAISMFASAQQSAPAVNGSKVGIPYRHEEPVSSLNMSGVFIALLLLGAGTVWVWRSIGKNGKGLPRRFPLGNLGGMRNQRLKLVETLHLSPRSRVHLIELDGQALLIGENQGSLHFSTPATAETKNEVVPAE